MSQPVVGRFTETWPTFTSFVNLVELVRLSVKIAAERPYAEAFTSSMASPSVPNARVATTGPNTSSFQSSASLEMFVSRVGLT